jgi:hypothetical protein
MQSSLRLLKKESFGVDKMKKKSNFIKQNWDILIELALILIIFIYVMISSNTCESWNCLGIAVFGILSVCFIGVIQTITDIVLLIRKKKFSILRWVFFIISIFFSLWLIYFFISSYWYGLA